MSIGLCATPMTGLFDLTEHISPDRAPALKNALEDNMKSTQKLITSFMQLGAQKQSSSLREEAYKECRKVQNEVTSAVSNPLFLSSDDRLVVHRSEV